MRTLEDNKTPRTAEITFSKPPYHIAITSVKVNTKEEKYPCGFMINYENYD